MSFSSPRRGRRRVSSGFTLLEILVVVVVISIFFLAFSLSINLTGRDRGLEKEIDRLVALVDLAAEEAVLQGREYGVWFDRESYEFFVLSPDTRTWISAREDEYFRPRQLEEDLEFKLWLEGRQVVLGDPLNPEDPRPHIMILSSGELTPFELHLERAFTDDSYVYKGEADGKTEVIDPNDDA